MLHGQIFRQGTTSCTLSEWHSDSMIIRCRTSGQLRVLKKLSASGLGVRLDKCKLMAPSVTYLGHRIDSEGLHPTEDKIRAIRDAPALRNVTWLKAFLELFQFYSGYVPNVADKLPPPIPPVAEGRLLEVGNRSLFSTYLDGLSESLQITSHSLVFSVRQGLSSIACHQKSSGGPCWWVHMIIALCTNREQTLLLLTQWVVYLYKKIYKYRRRDVSFT